MGDSGIQAPVHRAGQLALKVAAVFPAHQAHQTMLKDVCALGGDGARGIVRRVARAVYGVGGAGVALAGTAFSENIRFHVSFPTTPSTVNALCFWNALTALDERS